MNNFWRSVKWISASIMPSSALGMCPPNETRPYCTCHFVSQRHGCHTFWPTGHQGYDPISQLDPLRACFSINSSIITPEKILFLKPVNWRGITSRASYSTGGP